MLPYARLTPGTGFRPGNAAGYYAQRLAVRPILRNAVASAIAGAINLRHGGDFAAIPPRLAQPLASLRADGLIHRPSIAPEKIQSLLSRLANRPVVGSDGNISALADIAPGIPQASYSMATLLSCPEIFEIANDPDTLSLARTYLGCRPTIASIGVRWSFTNGKAKGQAQNFHRDLDDWRSLKYFVYLTDVAPDTGPHLYVKGSHKTPLRFRAKPYSEREISDNYGGSAVEMVSGPAGHAFMADTLGIHCGAPPRSGPRLILQIQYTILPVYAFLYRPLPGTLPSGSDRYMYRLGMSYCAQKPKDDEDDQDKAQHATRPSIAPPAVAEAAAAQKNEKQNDD